MRQRVNLEVEISKKLFTYTCGILKVGTQTWAKGRSTTAPLTGLTPVTPPLWILRQEAKVLNMQGVRPHWPSDSKCHFTSSPFNKSAVHSQFSLLLEQAKSENVMPFWRIFVSFVWNCVCVLPPSIREMYTAVLPCSCFKEHLVPLPFCSRKVGGILQYLRSDSDKESFGTRETPSEPGVLPRVQILHIRRQNGLTGHCARDAKTQKWCGLCYFLAVPSFRVVLA